MLFLSPGFLFRSLLQSTLSAIQFWPSLDTEPFVATITNNES